MKKEQIIQTVIGKAESTGIFPQLAMSAILTLIKNKDLSGKEMDRQFKKLHFESITKRPDWDEYHNYKIEILQNAGQNNLIHQKELYDFLIFIRCEKPADLYSRLIARGIIVEIKAAQARYGIRPLIDIVNEQFSEEIILTKKLLEEYPSEECELLFDH